MQTNEAVVLGIIQETPDTRSFLLDLPAGCAAYQAGQHLSISVPCGNTALSRSYSFSSAPEVDGIPTLTVRRVTSGKVSTWLHERLTIGSVIQVRPPAGQFVLSQETHAPLLLMGAGSGITPLMSLAKAALARTHRPVRLFYANSSLANTVFRRQLDMLVKQHGARFDLRYHIDELEGFPTAEALAQQFLDLEPSDVYVCGPRPFMHLVSEVTPRSAPHAALHIEHFAGAAAAVSAPSAAQAARVLWALRNKPMRFCAEAGQTLLEAARAAGHDPVASCEEGYCGACAVRLVAGQVKMNVCDGLSAAKRAQGWILPCQAHALTPDIELEV